MNLQRMNHIPRVGTLHLLASNPRVVLIQVPGNSPIFYRGQQEILQMVLTDLEISQMMEVLEEQGVPYKWIENPVVLHQRTENCRSCPFYHPGFHESCSLRWDRVPDTAGLEEFILACPDPPTP